MTKEKSFIKQFAKIIKANTKQNRREFDEVFERLRLVETAKSEDRIILNNIEKSQDDSKAIFQRHDEEEMQKYGAIEKAQNKIFKSLWIMTGVGLTLQLVVVPLVLMYISEKFFK